MAKRALLLPTFFAIPRVLIQHSMRSCAFRLDMLFTFSDQDTFVVAAVSAPLLAEEEAPTSGKGIVGVPCCLARKKRRQ